MGWGPIRIQKGCEEEQRQLTMSELAESQARSCQGWGGGVARGGGGGLNNGDTQGGVREVQ